jgi:hypothetical protein
MRKALAIFLLGTIVGSLSAAITTFALLRSGWPISTSRIAIVDGKGNVRASLGTAGNDQVALEFFSLAGNRQLLLGVQHESSTQSLLQGNQDQSRIPAKPILEVDNLAGKRSAVLSTTEDGTSALSFYGSDDLWHLGMGRIGDGGDYKPLWIWGVQASKGNALTTFGVYDSKTSDGSLYIAPSVKQQP